MEDHSHLQPASILYIHAVYADWATPQPQQWPMPMESTRAPTAGALCKWQWMPSLTLSRAVELMSAHGQSGEILDCSESAGGRYSQFTQYIESRQAPGPGIAGDL